MDPNNGQSTEKSDSVLKLEEDLKRLSEEAQSTPKNEVSDTNLGQTESTIAQPEKPVEAKMELDAPVEDFKPDIKNDDMPVQVPMSSKGSPMLVISLALVVVALLVAIAYVVGMKYFSTKSGPVACTTEAKMCEDGTSVGRSGPNCEFDACPTPVAESTPEPTSGWNTYTNSAFGYSLKFPVAMEIEGLQPGVGSGKISSSSAGIMLFNKQATSSAQPSTFLQLEVDSSKNIARKNYDLWSSDIEKNFTSNYGLIKKTTINIGNLTNVSKLEGLSAVQKTPVIAYFFRSGGVNSNFFYILISAQNQEQVTLFDTVVSTFVFTNMSTTTIPTSTPTAYPSTSPVSY